MSLLGRLGNGVRVRGDAGHNQPSSQDKTGFLRTKISTVHEDFEHIKFRVQDRVIAELDPEISVADEARVRRAVEEIFEGVVRGENVVLTRVERLHLLDETMAEILGYGPIDPLLKDESITEVMVNGSQQVYVERGGKLYKTDVTFRDDAHVKRIIDRIVSAIGRRVDESTPTVDARLPDGSRVNAVIPPISLIGPVLTVRKFSKDPLTVEDLIRFGTLTREVVQFLQACVECRLNIIISGGTGSGKTTLLNVLSACVPADERIVTIEDAAELRLHQEHVVSLETRKANIEGTGEITTRALVINALRMRPDRIVVGEVRGGEALDMLQAMNTGHDGSMTTLHANGPKDVLSRLETMVLMAGYDLPMRAIRGQVTSAIDLIVHQQRLKDGSRKVTSVTEVGDLIGDEIELRDIFVLRSERAGGKQRLQPTGIVPAFIERLENASIPIGPDFFSTSKLVEAVAVE